MYPQAEPAVRVSAPSQRNPLDTRTFIQFVQVTDAPVVEILANGRPFATLKQGEVVRVPLWPAMFRGQRVETIFLARGYDEQGRLVGTDTKRVTVRGGDRRGREVLWEIRRLRRIQ